MKFHLCLFLLSLIRIHSCQSDNDAYHFATDSFVFTVPLTLFLEGAEAARRAAIAPADAIKVAIENSEALREEEKDEKRRVKESASELSVSTLPFTSHSNSSEVDARNDAVSSLNTLASRNTSSSIEKNEYSNPYPVFHLLTPDAQPQDTVSEMVKRTNVNLDAKLSTLSPERNKSTVKRIDLINSQSTHATRLNISPLFYATTNNNHQEQYKSVVICDKTLAILLYSSLLLKCELFDLEKNPGDAYEAVRQTGLSIKQIPFQEMRSIINNCRALDSVINSTDINNTSAPATSDIFVPDYAFTRSWKALLPGTKWCGSGDSAANYADLGKRRDLDLCCRAHDHCPIRLKALRTGYDQINLSLYTKSHCDCDEDFKNCLKSLSSKSADAMANFFFNILRVQCIRTKDRVI